MGASAPARTSEDRIAGFPRAVVFAALAVAGVFLALYFANYGNWFIHPHQFEVHLPRLALHSLANIFQQFDSAESRPRFLAYLIIWMNLNLRMVLYDWFVLYPPFSIAWLLELVIGPLLLFRLVRNMTANPLAPWVSLLVYGTSIGFLSGFAMPLLPSKPLTNVVFITVLWLMSEARKKVKPDQMLHEASNARKVIWLLGIVLLAGLFLDEVPLFAFLLPPLFYPEMFFPRTLSTQSISRAARSALPLAVPVVVFLFVTVAIVPIVTQKLFGYRFDFISSVFVNKDAAEAGKTFFSGKTYGFSLESLVANIGSLFGSALMPPPLAKFVTHPSGGGVITGIETHARTLIAVLTLLTGLVALSLKGDPAMGSHLRKTLVAALLFLVFMSLLSGRHVPFISGYVYGGAFSVFLAMMAGLAVGAARSRVTACVVALTAVAVSAVQLVNFNAINKNWIKFHNEQWVRPTYEKVLRIAADGRATTRSEVQAIHHAWQNGRLDAYLAENSISSGAIFLVFELRHLDTRRSSRR